MKKLILKLLPYIICVLTGIIIFFIERFTLNPDIQNLVLNISSGLISVPFVFISYELVKNITERKLRARINTYIKYHIEKSLFGVLKYFYAWFYPTEKNPIIITDAKLDTLFDLEIGRLERFFMERKMLGFFIYKNITPLIDEMKMVIENPNLNSYISSEEMVHFMDILRNISLIKKATLEFISEDSDTRFVIKDDPNPHNTELELFNNDIKIDVGEFGDVERDKLLEYFRVPTENIELLSKQILALLNDTEIILELMNIDFWSEDYPYDLKKSLS
ncbi:MAG: hypothetical protein ACI4N3_03295 [Alphaproteobacteria bacterium]